MRSLRARLITAFVVPTALIVVALVVVAYDRAREGMETELEERLKAVGQVISAEMSEGIDAAQLSRLDDQMPRVHGGLQRRLRAVREATAVERVVLFDREARSLVDTDEEGFVGEVLYRVQADREEWSRSFAEGQATAGPLFRGEQGEYHKTAYVPIFLDEEPVAVVGVVASATYFDLLARLATVLTLLGVVGVVVVVLIGLWFAAVLVRPVDALVDAAGRLAEGELTVPLEEAPGQTEELAFLMRSFEEMRRSIVERDEQMRLMLSGIAHEVRNPLGGMELFCGLLKEELLEDGASSRVEMVERIERELGYLSRVVSEFLAFARPVEVQLERVSGKGLIDEMRELCEGEVLKAGCSLVLEVEEGVELTVDPGRLRRGVLNVVRNAWQACPQGATIRVRCLAEGEVRVVEVSDDGPGIEEDRLEELCKPFYTTREKGSGLGLSLTRRIVEDHRGTLVIQSRPGEGTTVRMELPFDESIDAAREQKEAQVIPEGWLG
jgi:signal transduction histidine kinase